MPDDIKAGSTWEPPETLSRDDLIARSESVLARSDIPFDETEHIFRFNELGLDWDVGVMVYQPKDPSKIPAGADGRKVGMFLLHGGSGDYRVMQPLARLLCGKFGYKIASMTYPGRLYLPDQSRRWPGDTVGPDGRVRTPIWLADETVAPEEFELVRDTSLRARYGTRLVARAREGSRFYDRMAAWPVAFETAMKTICLTHLPESAFSIYVHGHSTGGPFVHMLTQRVANIVGVVGIENSPFAYIYQAMLGFEWTGPFNDLTIRTWRDVARYKGAEVLSQEGPTALLRLPWVMEDVFDDWDRVKDRPQFKAEYPIHYASTRALTAAAKAAAERLKMDRAETDALVARYLGYCRELTGVGVKPVPPILLSICKHSRDHTEKAYREVVVPMLRRIQPQPRVNVVRLGTGTHAYQKPEEGLPRGIVPPIADFWHDAIMNGYYVKAG